jgi:hypothetical protein
LRRNSNRHQNGKGQENQHKHNEAKYKILATLYYSDRFLTPEEIADETGLTNAATRTRLSKMFLQGYLWRRKDERACRTGYCYRYLKPMGVRVLKGSVRYIGLEERIRIKDLTGMDVPMNLKKQVPSDAMSEYRRLISC